MRVLSFVLSLGATCLGVAACSADDGEPDRITRIDGPVQVEDDSGADSEGILGSGGDV